MRGRRERAGLRAEDAMSAFGGKADMTRASSDVRL
jgi:hypothetical protein